MTDPSSAAGDALSGEVLDSHRAASDPPEPEPEQPPVPAEGRAPTTADQAWLALAGQLTPAASLTRVDTATARVVTSVTVIGTLLTGLGVVGASTTTVHGLARTLVAVAVGLSALSVVTALVAQVLTISRPIRPGNLVEVKAWYGRVFPLRARLAQTATVLLVLAGLAGGLAGVLIVGRSGSSPAHPASTAPSMAVVRIVTPDGGVNVTLQLTFRGLKPGMPVSASISSDSTDGDSTDGDSTSGDGTDSGSVAAQAVALAGPDGVAAISLLGNNIAQGVKVHVRADGGGRSCQAQFAESDQTPTLTCRTR